MQLAVPAIPVFYRREMLADSRSFSPSAAKPKAVVEDWQAAGLPIDVRSFDAASEVDLCLAHDPLYVRGVLAGEVYNGFGNKLPDIAATLPWTTGAMLAAAREALARGVACAPVSGFHHAHHDLAAGYCTFNGLVVTALRLLQERRVRRVLILDCDYHYGDGTQSILDKLGVGDAITNETLGAHFHEPSQARAYMAYLQGVFDRLCGHDLVLYQAGADVHFEDPLGGVLSAAQMRRRDELVFRAAHEQALPIAWDLAGGYQEPVSKVIALHRQTMEACVAEYVGPLPS